MCLDTAKLLFAVVGEFTNCFFVRCLSGVSSPLTPSSGTTLAACPGDDSAAPFIHVWYEARARGFRDESNRRGVPHKGTRPLQIVPVPVRDVRDVPDDSEKPGTLSPANIANMLAFFLPPAS